MMVRMHGGLVLLLAILLTDVACAAVQLDPKTGLWFPPYATPKTYLKRDPAHSYSGDVKRAFAENPALADDVCAAVTAQKESPSSDPSVRQYATMLRMTCMSRAMGARDAHDRNRHEMETRGGLSAIFQEEEIAIASIPREQRDAESARIFGELGDAEKADTFLRRALRAIALDPAFTFPAAELLINRNILPDGPARYSPGDLGDFLEQLYRTRVSTVRSDSAQWKGALPAVLLFRGKLADARAAAMSWAGEAPPDRIWYARSMVAVIDAASGKESNFAKLIAGCGASPKWIASHEGEPPSAYCESALSNLIIYALDAQRDRAPAPLARAAFELAAMQEHDWPIRLALVRAGGGIDHAGAKSRFEEMLADENAPGGARIDAVYYLAKLALEHEPAAAAPLFDCWLRMHDIQIPALPDDAWSRLAAMPEHVTTKSSDCFAPGVSSVDSLCVIRALELRMNAAIGAKQWSTARESIEKLLALMLTADHPPTGPVRYLLYTLASRMLNDAAVAKDAAPIFGYLAAQPHDSALELLLSQQRNDSKSANAPWPAEKHAANGDANPCERVPGHRRD
ncbi:MAG: hypothetical protein JWO97_2137 [Acidobacteria bacterium]|nr:hypothetical protein [Acidobacteriota bacterium]